jgi:hypothetical protein
MINNSTKGVYPNVGQGTWTTLQTGYLWKKKKKKKRKEKLS